jgi:hypothetical protein
VGFLSFFKRKSIHFFLFYSPPFHKDELQIGVFTTQLNVIEHATKSCLGGFSGKELEKREEVMPHSQASPPLDSMMMGQTMDGREISVIEYSL